MPRTSPVTGICPLTFTLDRDAVAGQHSELDEYTVEQALQVQVAEAAREAEVTYLLMGPPAAGDAVRKALSMGGDKRRAATPVSREPPRPRPTNYLPGPCRSSGSAGAKKRFQLTSPAPVRWPSQLTPVRT
jgi:hypothetical protein